MGATRVSGSSPVHGPEKKGAETNVFLFSLLWFGLPTLLLLVYVLLR